MKELYAAFALVAMLAQSTAPQQTPQTPQPQRGGGRGGRGGAQPLTLTTSAWSDGGVIPAKYAQPGHDVSPPLAWSWPTATPPDNVTSYVLIVHDLDAPIGNGTD